MKKVIKKLDFVMIVLIIILLLAIYGIVQIKVFGKRYVNYFGYTAFQVITGSMQPTIKIKDVVFEKITKNVEIGDIATFKYGNEYVTHRVIDKYDGFIVTKGDFNNSQDDPVPVENIIGKVIFIVSNVSTWIQVFKTPAVIIALVVSFIILRIFIGNKDISRTKE